MKIQHLFIDEPILNKIFTKYNVNTLRFIPRWIVFLLDLFVVGVANYISVLIFSGMGFTNAAENNVWTLTIVYYFVTAAFFILLKTYSGIIRHSTFEDALKLIFAQLGIYLSLVAVNSFWNYNFHVKLFSNSIFLFGILLGFFGLLLYRILVKMLFEIIAISTSVNPKSKVFIYGHDTYAMSVANAIKFEKSGKFAVAGFIHSDLDFNASTLMGLPYVKIRKKIPIHLRNNGAQALIIADKNLSREQQLKIVESCLDYNMMVYTLNVVNKSDEKFTIKNLEIEDLLEREPIQLDKKTISNQLHNKVVLITGAAGSIGSEMVLQVLAFKPQKLVLIDCAETALHQLKLQLEGLNTPIDLHYIISDIRDKDLMSSIFERFQPDVVYHAAAYKHVPMMEENPYQAVLTNVHGTKIIADLALQYQVEKFVMVSTDKAVNPSNVMGASKRIAEKYIQSLSKHPQAIAYASKFITTRFGNVLGSNGSVVPLFKQQIEKGGPVTITHPDIIRYFMTISEACQLVMEAGAMGNGGEIYIFDMGKPVKIIDLANKMIRLAGLIPNIDIKIDYIGLRPGEKLFEELLNNSSLTISTHHEKIMIAMEKDENYTDLSKKIDELITVSRTFDSLNTVTKMKDIVPEFKSMNSTYVSLDIY